MSALLALARAIDALNRTVGRAVYWLVLAAVLVSSVNAIVRYTLDTSSNAWLELQWYLFSAVFLLGAGYTLQRNEHIRIDLVYGFWSRRTQVWIEIFGTVVFLLPTAILIGWLGWPMFLDSFLRGEMSGNAGGLIRWPVKLLIPAGFALLALQGVAELIKRVAFLAGRGPDPAPREPSEQEIMVS